jgi:hypothetical protein
MGIISRAGDLFYTFRFLKLLITKFEDTEAFKLGIIDIDGVRQKDVRVDTSAERSAYTPFHRLVFNIKKVLAKAPGGKTTIGSYAAALFLLKEQFGISEKSIQEGLVKLGVDPLDFIIESNQWFVLEDKRLSPGSYKLKNNKLLNSTLDEVAKERDFIRISDTGYPIGHIFGMDVYEAIHTKTNKTVYVTVEELLI